MKSKAIIFITIILTEILFFICIPTQAEEESNQLLFIEEVFVDPSGASAFEAEIKQSIHQYSAHKFPYPFQTYRGNDFHYYFICSLKNYADIDSFFRASSEFIEKVGVENIQSQHKRLIGVIKNSKYYFFQYIPEISYKPENPRLKPEERTFYNWAFFHVKFGMEKEFAEILKEWLTLYKSKEIPNEYSFYVGSIGTEMPVYIAIESGRDAADFFAEIHNTNEKFGEEGKALWEKIWPLIKEFEMKQCTWCPELSYIPEE
jgi:hypothetical protein